MGGFSISTGVGRTANALHHCTATECTRHDTQRTSTPMAGRMHCRPLLALWGIRVSQEIPLNRRYLSSNSSIPHRGGIPPRITTGLMH